MDGCNKVRSKKKDGMDRIKQAEKKKRRLEKALATSAAIRTELEKKKQRKKEEQQRLDEEGAAIAEAVALHVLLGEDSDDSLNDSRSNIISSTTTTKNERGLLKKRWDNLGMFTTTTTSYNGVSRYWVSNPEYGYDGSHTEWSESMGSRYIGEECWHDVAEAVSSLRITQDTNMY